MKVTRLALTLADKAFPGRLSILIFHRVLPSPDPLFPQEPDHRAFDRLMGLVAANYQVLPLAQALQQQAAGRLPSRALAITFDDGYADNAEIALPILHRHGLPATFFVATGFLDGGIMFNDVVIETLRATRRERIDVDFAGLGAWNIGDAASRRAVIDVVLPAVKYLALDEREAFLRQLRAAAGDPELPRDLMMRSEQVLALHRAGMGIGGHTVNHPILRLLPDDAVRAEIADGRDALQALVQSPVDLFAYPNGRPGSDYAERDVALVREAGFAAAVSTASGVCTAASDRFQLPRFTPWDASPARWLGRLVHMRATGAVHAIVPGSSPTTG